MLSGEEIRFSTFSFSTKTRFHMILDMHHINLNKFVKGRSEKENERCVMGLGWRAWSSFLINILSPIVVGNFLVSLVQRLCPYS